MSAIRSLCFLISGLFGAMSLAAGGPVLAAAERPNIVVFLVDDMGWQDTSVPFHSDPTPWNNRYDTPNM